MTIVHRFLDDLTASGVGLEFCADARTSASRSRTAVVDSVIDALSQSALDAIRGHRRPLPRCPKAPGLSACLFPQCSSARQRFRASRRGSRAEDPQGVRRLAFGALRGLLRSRAGSHSSFSSMTFTGATSTARDCCFELLRAPNSPAAAPSSRDFPGTRRRSTSPFSSRCATVGLTPPKRTTASRRRPSQRRGRSKARNHAASTCERRVEAQRTARAIARESRGSPFLPEELVPKNRGRPPQAAPHSQY